MRYLPDGRKLADREALQQLLERPESTIRARCTPIAYDQATRRALYDYDDAAATLQQLQRRQCRPRTVQA